jgi:molecular chaperone DnaK
MKYTTVYDNQTSILVKILMGENDIASKNLELQSTIIKDLPKKIKGEAKILVNFEINKNGVLNVTVTDESNNDNIKKIENIQIIGSLTDNEIQNLKNVDSISIYSNKEFEEKINDLARKTYKSIYEYFLENKRDLKLKNKLFQLKNFVETYHTDSTVEDITKFERTYNF